MFSNQPAELLLPTPLRSCCSVSASSTSTSQQQRFLAGSSTSSGENALHLLRYHEDANELGHDATLSHPTGEVWCLSSNPRDGGLVVTCGGGSGGSNVAGGAATTKLWRIPAELLEKDDDLPYDDEDGDGNGGNGGSGQIMDSEAPVDLISEATLFVDSDDVLGGRITSALFRPVDPDDDGMFADSIGGGGGNGIDAAKDLITVNAATGILTRWDLEAGATEVGQILPPAFSKAGKTAVMAERRAAWDPHNSNLVAVTNPRGITIHDLRTGGGGGVSSIDDPLTTDVSAILAASSRGVGNHRYGTTDISYNPNLPNVLTTSGKDGLIKFWDLRTTTSSSSVASGSSSASYPSPTMATTGASGAKHQRRIQPMKMLRGGHTHWSNRVAYNPHHDQLLLSSGTDGIVNLWRVGSVSSAPLLDLDATGDGDGGDNDIIGLGGGGFGDDLDDEGEDRQDNHGEDDGGSGGGGDVRVSKFEFPDSVYDVCWSSTDAWTFLCVGYDGTVSLNHVPSREKYKILL